MRYGIARKIAIAIVSVVMIVISLFVGVILHDCLIGNDLIVEETTYTVEVVSWQVVEDPDGVMASHNLE